jgi:arylsulfatase A-like enzyme
MSSLSSHTTTPEPAGGIPRRDFLKLSAAAVLGSQFLGLVTQEAHASQLPGKMNLLLILSDQERAVRWFPAGWESQNLPTMTRLKNNGLTFSDAFTATSMCSPSRNTLFTGLFPAQHRLVDTLTEFEDQESQRQLDPTLPNLATCLKEAGYDVIYKGKWHMSKQVTKADGTKIPDDISRYGFDGWDAPDAGGDTATYNFGGGKVQNDARFLSDAIAFLQDRLAHPSDKPFCLILSLVNPHDLVSYPLTYNSGGYTDASWLAPTDPAIALPPTIGENLQLNKKPSAHRDTLNYLAAGLGPLATEANQKNYLNFYGNLMKEVDSQIGQLLAVMDNGGAAGEQMLNNTLIIRTSDHGENGLCHGGLRQKMFVAYEETIRVPLVWSNPTLYPIPQTSTAMVSHVDFLPTICDLTSVPNWAAKGFKGVSYSSIVMNPASPPVQDYVLFTFDDIYAGTDPANSPQGLVAPPNRLQMIRTADCKYVRYYNGGGGTAEQSEFYDLRSSGGDYDTTYGLPLEMRNLSTWAVNNFPIPPSLTLEQVRARNDLTNNLAAAAASRLQPRSANAPVPPEQLKLAVVRYSDSGGAHVKVQITFLSRSDETYQVQKSNNLVDWPDLGDSIVGNNGPILRSYDMSEEKAFYRIQWAVRS